MIPGWQSGTVIGILPGAIQVAYASPKIRVLKNRNDTANMTKAEEWCRITRRSLRDLSMMDNAFIISSKEPGVYDVDFVKCRNREPVLEWCTMQWGEPGADGPWEEAHVTRYSPYLFIRGDDNLMLFRMVWE